MAHLSVKHFSPFRNSFSPSLRHWRHLASRILAMLSPVLDAPALRRTATVVRNRGHVRDAGNLQPDRIERPHRRFAPRAGALDADLDVLHAAFLRRPPGAL